MTAVTVHTQAELDAALAAHADTIYIKSEAGVWLTLTSTGSSRVVAWGSSHVVAWGSSHVEAGGSSHVEAWGSSRVEARGSSHVEAGGYVAVHLHSGRATVNGGVLIDLTALELTDPTQWADYVGAKPDSDGYAVLYKAVHADLKSDQGMAYPPGEVVSAPDWRDDHECGGGLHLSPSPALARAYTSARWDARFLACRVRLADVRSIGADKCKVPWLLVLHEVDVHADPLPAEQVAS